ncbi:hypothetical protein [Actinokineospora sp. HUAS TT18]|uniref:hypothetical protein n=1 Tax=Actinokineospora sp. HUAS TT18 TaxID=3447451 RepID=UPI003F520F79
MISEPDPDDQVMQPVGDGRLFGKRRSASGGLQLGVQVGEVGGQPIAGRRRGGQGEVLAFAFGGDQIGEIVGTAEVGKAGVDGAGAHQVQAGQGGAEGAESVNSSCTALVCTTSGDNSCSRT